MNKYGILFEYFRQCPYLADMMSIAAESEAGNSVILPQGASPAVEYIERYDALGNYLCEMVPYLSVYEDFQINCYVYYDTNDTNPPRYNGNVLTYEEVCGVCEWIREQNEERNFPEIGEKIISIECNPFVPQVRGTDTGLNVVGYFITVRIRYVNRAERRNIYYELDG